MKCPFCNSDIKSTKRAVRVVPYLSDKWEDREKSVGECCGFMVVNLAGEEVSVIAVRDIKESLGSTKKEGNVRVINLD